VSIILQCYYYLNCALLLQIHCQPICMCICYYVHISNAYNLALCINSLCVSITLHNAIYCIFYVYKLHYTIMITNSAYVRVQGHDASADVTAVCMTYDGTWLLSAGSDGLLNVYRLRCYKLHHIHFLLVVNTTHTILYHTVMNHEAL
jgi:hypothetical protein